ncbi:hypothetical protein SH2C18_50080 [Clostridium sediminicola]|uniref:hypothetical protein n=1 Tax=Clostridium sediminicola TaxID=3114879 RepID=UPI0031F1E597
MENLIDVRVKIILSTKNYYIAKKLSDKKVILVKKHKTQRYRKNEDDTLVGKYITTMRFGLIPINIFHYLSNDEYEKIIQIL